MTSIFGIPTAALFGQLLLGLINGSFYAILSLGLAVIFGLLNIINFTHGAQYMMGAFVAWMLLNYLGVGYWWALLLAPIVVGAFGIVIERNLIAQLSSTDKIRSLLFLWVTGQVFIYLYVAFGLNILAALIIATLFATLVATLWGRFGPKIVEVLRRSKAIWYAVLAVSTVVTFAGVPYAGGSPLAEMLVAAIAIGINFLFWSAVRNTSFGTSPEPVDHLYGLLLTFGLALILQGLFRNEYGSSGLPYRIPPELSGGQNLGFMFLPNYRGWVVVASAVVCLGTWFVIEKTRLGAYLRAATENATLTQAFGINVPRLVTLTYGFGVGLAAFAGVLAAPIYSVNPNMGADVIIVVFAVVVIGGMGSILGSILTGFGLGIIEGLTKVFYPEASATVIFIIMAIVLLIKPAGLFGRA